ncbi:MAG TPA: S9 family peptidase [Vicinamibacteria bacterium]|jgi:oligopeptidase B|nr:S9 family peptidase [Vicinamibacteria bacterium]
MKDSILDLSAPAVPAPPVAPKAPKVDVLHGDRRVDDYFWLRDKTNPAVAAYLQAENAYTDAVMKPTAALREALYKEMLARIKETDESVPYRKGGYWYYSRTEQGKQYPIHCRRKGSREAPEAITLDLNQLAEGQKFMALGSYAVSDDASLLAYSTDNTGFRQYTLQVKDLRTGEVGPLRAERTGSVAWCADNKTLFYTVEEESTKRQYRLYRHRLGTSAHDLVYEEGDEAFSVSVHRTRSLRYLILSVSSHTTSEARYLPADEPGGDWRLIAPRLPDEEYDIDHHGDLFYIRTNDRGRNFRLVSASVGSPSREHWREVVPHRSEVMLEGVDVFRDHYILSEREDGLPQFRVAHLRTGEAHRLAFPEPVYSAFAGPNPEFDTATFRYSYQSLVTPSSVFDYDLERRESTLLKQTEVLGGYEAARYRSERGHATAPDGVRIPLSIVYKEGLKRDGHAPLYLYGYGAYGFPLPIAFSSNRLSLLDRGVVMAFAHVRGGGDLGKPWHDDGRMMKKRNTFTDFIAAAEFLIAENFTRADRLVIEGASAGGLLMGAVANARPDLFKAVVLKVPFLDVINTMLDETLPLTVGEFEEWGNPKKKEEYDYLKTYCPYTNLEAKAYPAMLVKTSFHDSQVMYWEPAKYVARLRTLKTDPRLLLLKINLEAGHGGASGRYDFLHEVAFDYAFILGQLGITE